MNAALRALEAGLPVPDEKLTVGQFLDHWLASLPGSMAESTETTYATRIRLYLSPALGHLRLRSLSPADVASMLREMDSRGLSPETQRLTRAVLRRALRVAEQEGLVVRNVAAIADGPKGTRAPSRSMTATQAQAFLLAAECTPARPTSTPGPAPTASLRLSAAVLLGLGLGLRRGETLGLRWDDLDLDADRPQLQVRQQLVRRPNGLGLGLVATKTPKSRRDLRLPVEVAASLRRHRAGQNAERLAAGTLWGNDLGLVFTTPLGTPVDPRNFNRLVSDIAKRAGLGHWHPHELRHSAASLLLAAKVPLETVSETLGLSSIRITKDVYGHLLDGARDEAATAMSAVLWGPG
jgi:integrase